MAFCISVMKMVQRSGNVHVHSQTSCVWSLAERTGQSLVVRACSVKSMDHQCGVFSFDNEYFDGCVTTCPWDGCNASVSVNAHSYVSMFVLNVCVTYVAAVLTAS